MPQVKTKFSAGLSDSAGAASPEFVESSLNWFWSDGTLKKRNGMVPTRALSGLKRTQTGAYHGTVGAATTIATAGTTIAMEPDATLMIWGADAVFNRVCVTMGADLPLDSGLMGDGTNWGLLQYWNGSDWENITEGNARDESMYVINSAPTGEAVLFPGGGVADADTYTTDNSEIEFCFHPPEDWATTAIGGQTKYWVRIVLADIDYASGPPDIVSSYVYTETNRILSLLYFTDRNGTSHEFTTTLYGESGDQIMFHRNGTLLTAADGLVPVTGAGVFSESTKVQSFYHASTDRVIGHISGFGWFYHIIGDSNVYQLVADPLGTDYTETQPDGGWEAAVPDASVVAVHDSRIWAALGNEIRWSQPEAFVDLWASRNVAFLDDGLGPITAMAVFQGSLIFFKSRAIYAAQQNGANEGDSYDFVPLSNGIGCVGPVIKSGDALFFVGNDGFYVFDGQRASKLNSSVDHKFAGRELGCDFSLARGAYHSMFNQLRWFVPKTDGANILDAAVYMSASTLVTQGEKPEPIGVYPQGRVSELGQFGFGATCVAEDSTGPVTKVMLGGMYGMIFEMDVGHLDNGTIIEAEVIGCEQNFAGSDRFMAGPVFVFQDGTAYQGYVDVTLIPDGDETKGKTIKAYSYEHGRSRSYSSFAYNSTMRLSSSGVSKRCNHMVRCHTFAVKIAHARVGSPEINGVSIEVVPIGNRGN